MNNVAYIGDTTSKHFPPQGDYVVPLALPGWPTDEEFNIMQVNGSELLDSIRVYVELAVRKHDHMGILDVSLSFVYTTYHEFHM